MRALFLGLAILLSACTDPNCPPGDEDCKVTVKPDVLVASQPRITFGAVDPDENPTMSFTPDGDGVRLPKDWTCAPAGDAWECRRPQPEHQELPMQVTPEQVFNGPGCEIDKDGKMDCACVRDETGKPVLVCPSADSRMRVTPDTTQNNGAQP